MAKMSVTCPICGFTAKTDEPIPACPQCGANLMQPSGEIVLDKVHGSYSTGHIGGTAGWLFLTNMRLFFIKDAANSTGYAVGGLIGMAVQGAINKNKTDRMDVCLALGDIAPLEDTKVALMKALQLSSKTQGFICNLVIPKRDEWRDKINSAIFQYAPR